MSDTAMLMKEIEALPDTCLPQLVDFVNQLKHKVSSSWELKKTTRVQDTETEAEPVMEVQETEQKKEFVYSPDTPHWLIGAVNPELFGTVKTVGNIIGPFHDEWENGY
jgi:hypothetical protein